MASVTGAGAPGIAGTIYALKTNPDNRNVWVMGVDSRDDAVGRYMTDAFSTIPVSDNDEYINKLVEIAKENRIDVILPQVTSELDKISNASNMLRDEGIFSVISPSDTIHLANDKAGFELVRLSEEIFFFVSINTDIDLLTSVLFTGITSSSTFSIEYR